MPVDSSNVWASPLLLRALNANAAGNAGPHKTIVLILVFSFRRRNTIVVRLEAHFRLPSPTDINLRSKGFLRKSVSSMTTSVAARKNVTDPCLHNRRRYARVDHRTLLAERYGKGRDYGMRWECYLGAGAHGDAEGDGHGSLHGAANQLSGRLARHSDIKIVIKIRRPRVMRAYNAESSFNGQVTRRIILMSSNLPARSDLLFASHRTQLSSLGLHAPTRLSTGSPGHLQHVSKSGLKLADAEQHALIVHLIFLLPYTAIFDIRRNYRISYSSLVFDFHRNENDRGRLWTIACTTALPVFTTVRIHSRTYVASCCNDTLEFGRGCSGINERRGVEETLLGFKILFSFSGHD
ncbi:hypothetical protein EV421DRAFT_1900919 [Armillaria borealis]|uniref:Uncharacterized protein n=1 Tax=Armillaria borealis TaxID=47425 RepID=A0AA39JRS2_9AGAR|nr:hypothetical protein EV421DRAFT_1900919 [Armillaria borealis]